MSSVMMAFYLLLPVSEAFSFYMLCAFLGFCNGYWTLFITIAAELFGTNIRATVATTIPNFVRGATIPLASLFVYLKPTFGVINAGLILGVSTAAIALISLFFLEETFTKDLDYLEGEESGI